MSEEKKQIEEKQEEVSKETASGNGETTLEKGEDFVETGPGEEMKNRKEDKAENELVERVIKINRVSKVVKGGKNFSFSAMVVIGNTIGRVGIGFGKSNEVVEAIKKGAAQAKGNFVNVNLDGDTIPHEIIGEFKASRVIMKPAGPGTGVIAGSAVRAMCDAVGIKNILTKSLGSRNSLNVVRATMDGFMKLRLKRRG
jgi:small subunit ribosomal protein S5